MSKIAYAQRGFTDVARQVIAESEIICQDYARQGYSLTLRQLYYRFIATDAFPESRRWSLRGGKWVKDSGGTKNAEPNYKWLGDLVSDARIAGLVDWSHIIDRTRSESGGDYGWDSPAEFIESVTEQYSVSKWDGQAHYVEVWVEKEALEDVIARPAGRWNVTHMACKGSPSTSVIHKAAQRFRQQERDGRTTHLVYLGDHDPTGIDISRDIADRMELFRAEVQVDRIALNMDQVLEFDPPPSPAKPGDSRSSGYIERFGTEDTWELDALEPAQLDGLVEEAILSRLDRDGWNAREAVEQREQEVLSALGRNWLQVREYMEGMGLVDPDEEEDPDA